MQKRICESMKTDLILNGIIEIDETYIGGALRNMTPEYKKNVIHIKAGWFIS